MLLRVCIATIASHVFFCRGECGACARREDLVVNNTHMTLRLNKKRVTNTSAKDRNTQGRSYHRTCLEWPGP